MSLGKALVIFLALSILTIVLICITLIKKGSLVKNPVVFAGIQLYTIITSILILIFRADGNILGYILGVIYIVTAIGVVYIMKTQFFIARMVTVSLIVLSFLSFWYNESFHIFIVIPIIAVVAGIILLKIKSKREL
jgi:hypothetical protein